MASRWNPALGPALLVPDDSATDPASATVDVLRPIDSDTTYTDSLPFDLRPLSGLTFDLFGRGGRMGTVALTAGISRKDSSETCTVWPKGRIAPNPFGWTVALQAGRATALPLDSMPTLSSTDSALVVAEITRVASSIPQTNDSVFSRVPFVVRRAYRFQVEGEDGVMAFLQRSIPSEATARVENLVVIMEREHDAGGAYHPAFARRLAGKESATVETDVLALLTVTSSQTNSRRTLFIVNDAYFEGARIGMIERIKPGLWRETWRSAYSGC